MTIQCSITIKTREQIEIPTLTHADRIVESLIHLMNGSIWMNQSIDYSTLTLSLTWKCAIQPSIATSYHHDLQHQQYMLMRQSHRHTIRILIVDDCESNHHLLIRMIQHIGLSYYAVSTIQAAHAMISTWKQETCDYEWILLMDQYLSISSEMHGVEFIQLLLQEYEYWGKKEELQVQMRRLPMPYIIMMTCEPPKQQDPAEHPQLSSLPALEPPIQTLSKPINDIELTHLLTTIVHATSSLQDPTQSYERPIWLQDVQHQLNQRSQIKREESSKSMRSTPSMKEEKGIIIEEMEENDEENTIPFQIHL